MATSQGRRAAHRGGGEVGTVHLALCRGSRVLKDNFVLLRNSPAVCEVSPRAGTSGTEGGAPGKLLLTAHLGLPSEQSCSEAPPWASSSLWPPHEMSLPQGLSPSCPTSALTPKACKGNSRMDTQRGTPGTQNRREEERGVLYTFATRNVQHSKEGRAAPPARQLLVPGHPRHRHQTPGWDQELG